MTKRLLPFLLIALLAGACGRSTPASESPSPSEAPSPSASAQVVAPLIVAPDEAVPTLTVGQTVVFALEQPEVWNVTVTEGDPLAVEISQGRLDGDATFNPGLTALAPATLKLQIENQVTGELLEYAIVIE